MHTFRLRFPKRNVVFGAEDVATTTVEGAQARGFIEENNADDGASDEKIEFLCCILHSNGDCKRARGEKNDVNQKDRRTKFGGWRMRDVTYTFLFLIINTRSSRILSNLSLSLSRFYYTRTTISSSSSPSA